MKAQIKYFHLNQYSASSITLLREEMNNHIIKFTVQAATSENDVKGNLIYIVWQDNHTIPERADIRSPIFFRFSRLAMIKLRCDSGKSFISLT